jgi:hypothetical protein
MYPLWQPTDSQPARDQSDGRPPAHAAVPARRGNDHEPDDGLYLVRWQQHNLALLAIGLFVVGVVALLVGVAVAGEEVAIAGGVLGMIGVGVLLFWVLECAAGLGTVARQLADLKAGAWLAHWRYEPQEWRRFVTAERDRALWDAVGATAVSGGASVLLALVSASRSMSLALCVLFVGGCFTALVSCGVLLNGLARYRYRSRVTGEAYLGKHAVALSGTFHTLTRTGRDFQANLLGDDHPVLRLTIRRGNQFFETVDIPVPAGREDEARQVLGEWANREQPASDARPNRRSRRREFPG